jgi:hypothetical protein
MDDGNCNKLTSQTKPVDAPVGKSLRSTPKSNLKKLVTFCSPRANELWYGWNERDGAHEIVVKIGGHLRWEPDGNRS